MGFTGEQQAILDAAKTGEDMVITALAGTGKTYTLRAIGEQQRNRSGCLFAYNGSIAREAKATFPRWVQCQTPHSMAFRWKARRVGWDEFQKAVKRRVPAWKSAELLGIRRALTYSNNKRIKPATQARLVKDMIQRFCWSSEEVLLRKHCPQVEGLDHNDWYALSSHLLPIAQRYWESVEDPTRTPLEYTHDMYLKQWALTNPRLPFDYVLFDEAQDANPVVTKIVQSQTHCQRIAVGDSYQAIYTWRGAVDAIKDFPAQHRLPLTMSFRFGDAIAEVANEQLITLGADLRIVGNPRRKSVVERYEFPHVMLCRTNAGALDELLEAQKRNFGTHLVGGSGDIGWFCRSVQALKAGKEVTHPDLAVFESWQTVQDHVADDPTTEFALMVNLVEKFGEDVIVGALDNTTDAELAELVISTGHKAKGLQWITVRLCQDFDSLPGVQLPDERIRLQYVAVTRAIELLDPGPLRTSVRI